MYLALDFGTQSSRAILFNQDGRIVDQASCNVEYQQPETGFVERDAVLYWQDIKHNLQTLSQRQSLAQVKGLSITCQAGTDVCCDEHFNPLYPAISWTDQRQGDVSASAGIWQWLFKLVGQLRSFQYFRAEANINWIKQHRSEVYTKIAHYGLLSTYLHARLLKKWTDSTAGQVGYLPFNFRKHRWAKRWDWKHAVVAVQQAWLAELKAPGEVLGHLPEDIAAELGLPAQLPVIASGSDKACEILGCGTLDTHTACLSFGTQASIAVVSPVYKEAIHLIPPFPSAVAGHFNVMIMINKGFSMLRWFADQFGQRETRLADAQGVSPESLLESLLQESEPGCKGLLLQPYWNPGLKEPGREAKGAIIGFGDVHTRADIYRAIIEGIIFGLRDGLTRIERSTGTKVTSLMVSGGGSQSDGALQITADVFNMPVRRPHTFETSALGAAINIAVGIGDYKSVAEAANAMVHEQDCFHPIARNTELYQSLFERVYRRMYRRLQPLYSQIQRITGYPKV